MDLGWEDLQRTPRLPLPAARKQAEKTAESCSFSHRTGCSLEMRGFPVVHHFSDCALKNFTINAEAAGGTNDPPDK